MQERPSEVDTYNMRMQCIYLSISEEVRVVTLHCSLYHLKLHGVTGG